MCFEKANFLSSNGFAKCCFLVTNDICPGVTFDFPRDYQVTDYVRYRSYFPALNEGTICFWLNTSDYTADLTGLFSYAVSGSANEILVSFHYTNNLRIWMKNNVIAILNFTSSQLSGTQQVWF